MKKNNVLYILSNARVAALSKKDGAIIWEVKLKELGITNMTRGIGQIVEEEGKIFVGCNGVMACLDGKDGALIWKNELKGWGYNFISMANVNSDAASASIAASAAASAAATTAVIAAS